MFLAVAYPEGGMGASAPQGNFWSYVRPFPNFTGGVFTFVYAFFSRKALILLQRALILLKI